MYLDTWLGERTRDLTKQLLAFSKQVLDVKILNLNAVVQGMAKMSKRLLGEDLMFTFICVQS